MATAKDTDLLEQARRRGAISLLDQVFILAISADTSSQPLDYYRLARLAAQIPLLTEWIGVSLSGDDELALEAVFRDVDRRTSPAERARYSAEVEAELRGDLERDGRAANKFAQARFGRLPWARDLVDAGPGRNDRRERIAMAIAVLLAPPEVHIPDPPTLTDDDITLALRWGKPDLGNQFDTARTRLELEQLMPSAGEREAKVVRSMLSARTAELWAAAAYKSFGMDVEDVANTQLTSPSGGDWKLCDLIANGHPVDVKNCRRYRDRPKALKQHFVKRFKRDALGSDVRYAGVASYFTQISEMLGERALMERRPGSRASGAVSSTRTVCHCHSCFTQSCATTFTRFTARQRTSLPRCTVSFCTVIGVTTPHSDCTIRSKQSTS